jgi:hypothetical protein
MHHRQTPYRKTGLEDEQLTCYLARKVPAQQRRMQHENSSVCDGEKQTALSTMASSAAPFSKINRNIYPGHIETIKHRSAPKEH